jgi:hypothetical protein
VTKVRVTPRARSRPDRAGDPLDGLVNLFDLGIVLSVAFLIAALSSLKLGDILTNERVEVIRNTDKGQQIITRENQKVTRIQLQPGQKVVGRGDRIGSVYRLNDGRVVYVEDGEAPPPGATPADPPSGGSTPPTTETTPPPSTETTPTTPPPSGGGAPPTAETAPPPAPRTAPTPPPPSGGGSPD